MGEWSRDTAWRQGHLLPEEAFQSLLPGAGGNGCDSAVIISHDCDLAQPPDVEPAVEIILAKRIGTLDGNYTHAKNARRLHLSFTQSSSTLSIDIVATQKVFVEKVRLAEFEPDARVKLKASELTTLQQWLSLRYKRSAFPDEFDRRLGKADVPRGLAKILKPVDSLILALYFDIDQGEDIARTIDDEPYALSIYLLYTEQYGKDCFERATSTSEKIAKLFEDAFFDPASRNWTKIELERCEPISDEGLTYRQHADLKRWNGDHISLRAEPQRRLPAD